MKLSAVADRDPLAALGLLKIDNSADPAAARKLLNDNAAGVTGAMLIEALRDKVNFMPAGPAASAVRGELDKFPRQWLDLLEYGKVRDFYVIKAAPLKVAHQFGEPMLVNMMLTNTSAYDLTVGAEGAVHPDLWFDAQIRTVESKQLPGIAYDRLGGQLVLHTKESFTQTVRVDQGALSHFLMGNPQIDVPIYFSVLTNPLTQQGGIAPGPGGVREQFTHVVTRTPTPLGDEGAMSHSLQSLKSQAVNGGGDVRLRAVDELATICKLIRDNIDKQKTGDAGASPLPGHIADIRDAVRKSAGDSATAVRGVALSDTTMLNDKPAQEPVIRQMLGDAAPAIRALGLLAVQDDVEPAARKALAQPLADGDADATVKKLAASVIAVADLPPPTTKPAEGEKAGESSKPAEAAPPVESPSDAPQTK